MDDKLKDNRVTRSGLKIDPVYTNPNKNDSMHNDLPGEFPYTRGIRKDMYRGRLWTMRQYAGFASPEASNNRYKYLLGCLFVVWQIWKYYLKISPLKKLVHR